MMPRDYALGCPVWACDAWRGGLFRSSSTRSQWLTEYSSVFNCVEGNSTFYGLPSDEAVMRWQSETPAGFHFVLKFPQTVTHDAQLRGFPADARRFLAILELLARDDQTGPAMLQLPAAFSPTELPVLKRFLEQLPLEFQYAVEVRHRDFFTNRQDAAALAELLTAFDVHRVTFDSRALHAFPPTDAIEQESQQRKPNLPVSKTTDSSLPVLRLIGRNDLDRVQPWIDEWAPVIAGWILQGRRPYVFTHAPNDQFAPEMARRFHDALQSHLESRWTPLPAFPGESTATQQELW